MLYTGRFILVESVQTVSSRSQASSTGCIVVGVVVAVVEVVAVVVAVVLSGIVVVAGTSTVVLIVSVSF